ncbi:hypothetical protein GX51_05750 [Blastomyces parvus]|uniref:Histone-lysine N-methyltransferase SET5 n=1 Tax=Blastomyces parvus TaxID=2060905 RepID=A0A2B7WV38_9EURO|nr:hypothetical protein GX51_05750 [Blastomyces parvus]
MAGESSRAGQQQAGGPSVSEGVDHGPPPPYFPDRPDLFNEVEWGNLPTQEDVQKAYTLWSAQDSCLREENDFFRRNAEANDAEHLHTLDTILVRNVYENTFHWNPTTNHDGYAQFRRSVQTGWREQWKYSQIFHPNDADRESSSEWPPSRTLINGYDVLTDRFWTKVRLQEQLRARNLNPNGLVADLRQRLHDYEQRHKQSLLPREDLSHWGISRRNDFMIPVSAEAELKPLDLYTWAIILSPYNPAYWTSRAYLHFQMGYCDLAIGDAHRAQMLCEVMMETHLRSRQPGLYIRVWDAVEKHVLQIPTTDVNRAGAVKSLRGPEGVNFFIPAIRTVARHIISLSLLHLNCWMDYEAVEKQLLAQLTREGRVARERWDKLKTSVEVAWQDQRARAGEYFFESNYGQVTIRDYPCSARDIDRTTEAFKRRITEDFIGKSQVHNPHPKIAVDKDKEGNLGVFATQKIEAGETVYVDEPSIRGHLHVLSPPRKVEHYCENCKRAINPEMIEIARQSSAADQELVSRAICDCSRLSSEPLYWCPPPKDDAGTRHDSRANDDAGTNDDARTNDEPEPSSSVPARMVTRSQTARLRANEEASGTELGQKTSRKRQRAHTDRPDSELPAPPSKKPRSCLEIARSLYHYRACGKDWTWLHDSMRIPGRSSCTNERHGTILSLLLREVFDITLHRRKTDNRPALLAHEIDELLPLFGGKRQARFPFSYSANIRVPFDILMCLGVDIFRDLTFDTWVIQSVLRKLVPNIIPWDHHRRGRPDAPEGQAIKQARSRMEGTPDELDPTFRTLYLFPGVSMFNHFCRDAHNVMWDWDSSIPNRIILWARKAIEPDVELVLPYTNRELSKEHAFRLFQSACNCPKCRDANAAEYTDDGNDDDDDPSSTHTLGGSVSPRSDGGNDFPPGQDPDNDSTGEEPRSAQESVDRPENPMRQIKADENYDESTSLDSMEAHCSPAPLSPRKLRPRTVEGAKKEVSPRTYWRALGEK